MKTLTILVKPSSDKCNLQCHYCFYHDISNKRETKDYGFMSNNTAQKIIDNAFSCQTHQIINFAFQGGEPTLIGIDFFYQFIDYVEQQKRMYRLDITVQYSLQTNATRLNKTWLTFFKEHDFLIGLSLDGDRFVHDRYRIFTTGKGSYDKVTSILDRLKKQGIRFNILSVITSQLAHRINIIYPELKALGAEHLQFIPCLEPWDEKPNQQSWSLTAQDYGLFLSQLFTLWEKDVYLNKEPEIRYFSNLIGIMFGYLPESCDMRGTCAIQNVVEANGSIYPCDFYAFESMKIGHVEKQRFDQLHNEEKAQQFLNRSYKLPIDCQRCSFLQLCRSGCQRHNETEELGGKNRFCHSYLYFFNKHIRELEEVAEYISLQQERVS
ncbi:UNVERIFIED_CONTAM: hypothetical protein GTU68_010940 [Idotea baltica]|nr:hypothetical protein [Idotea baltica]